MKILRFTVICAHTESSHTLPFYRNNTSVDGVIATSKGSVQATTPVVGPLFRAALAGN